MTDEDSAWLDEVELRSWRLYRRSQEPVDEPAAVSDEALAALESATGVVLHADFRALLSRVGTLGGMSVEEIAAQNPEPLTRPEAAGRPSLEQVLLIRDYGSAVFDELVNEGPAAGTVWESEEGEVSGGPAHASVAAYADDWLSGREAQHGSGPLACVTCGGALSLSALRVWECPTCGQPQGQAADDDAPPENLQRFAAVGARIVETLVAQGLVELDPDVPASTLEWAIGRGLAEARNERAIKKIVMRALMSSDTVLDVFGSDREIEEVIRAAVGG